MVLKSVDRNNLRVEMVADGFTFKVKSTGDLNFERDYTNYVDADIIFEMLVCDGSIFH